MKSEHRSHVSTFENLTSQMESIPLSAAMKSVRSPFVITEEREAYPEGKFSHFYVSLEGEENAREKSNFYLITLR